MGRSSGVSMEVVKHYKYVHEDVDRHGNPRIYFWRGAGHKKIRIRARPGSDEFDEAYKAAEATNTLKDQAPVIDEVGKVISGTLKWLYTRYKVECAEYQAYDDETKKAKCRVIEAMLREPRKPGQPEVYANCPLPKFTSQSVIVLRDRKLKAPETANSRLKCLRKMFAWALEAKVEGVTSNPAVGVKGFRTATEGHHTWTREEVQQFTARHPLGTRAHLAMSIFLYTGVRVSDCAQMGPQMMRGGWIYFTETKGRSHIVKQREIKVLPELQQAIDAHTFQHLNFIVTEYGQPFSVKGLGNWFKARCVEAGLPHCSAHGLRKAGATIAAENGATEQELMAIYGWEDSEQAVLYTRKANKRRLVDRAIHKIRLDE